MTKIPAVPNRLPILLKRYKNKNKLSNTELVQKINNYISDLSDQIFIEKNEFENDTPISSFFKLVSSSKSQRPKNIQQRLAILKLLNINYTQSIFKDGQDIVQYFRNSYQYVVDKLNEIISNKKSLSSAKNALTQESLKELFFENNNPNFSQIGVFIYKMLGFIQAFNDSMALPFVTPEGVQPIEIVASSNFLMKINKLALNNQLSLESVNELDKIMFLEFIQLDTNILISIAHDLNEYRADFFGTFHFNKKDVPVSSPESKPNSFIYKKVYANITEKLNGLINTKNEKRALFNLSLFEMSELCDSFIHTTKNTRYSNFIDQNGIHKSF